MTDQDTVRRCCIKALYHFGRPVTAEEVATFYRLGQEEVLDGFRALKRSRIARDRKRKGVRVWLPWEGR